MPGYRNIPLDSPCYSTIAQEGDRTFCVTVPDMMGLDLDENTLKRGLKRHRDGETVCWPHHKEGKIVYIHYDGLKPNYQTLVRANLLNNLSPEEWYTKNGRAEEIKARLEPYAWLPAEDELFFDNAKYPNGEKLPLAVQNKAREACRWLTMLIRLDDKKEMKEAGYQSAFQLYEDAALLFTCKNIQLPKAYGKLRKKVKEYIQKGAACCVDTRGQSNKNASKVFNEEQTALLRSICGRGASYNSQQIADLYNSIAVAYGWEKISRRSALNYLNEYHLIVKAGRDGSEAFRNKISMQRRRKLPTEALSFWSVDGWTAELYYQKDVKDKNGKTIHTYTNRLTVVVILDACCNYPVGFAIGESESVKLIQAAVKDAVDHCRDMLGNTYRPYQIQSDHYGIKSMGTIYNDLAEYFTPARVKNAKAKPVERYFLGLNRDYCQFYFGNLNWSGFGIKSREKNQPNIDVLNANKSRFPDRDGVIEQISWIMSEERRKKRDAWLGFWNKMPEADRLIMDRETYLLRFGYRNERTKRLEAGCLEPVILGEKRAYDTFDLDFRKNPLQSWTIIYDDRDLSNILVVDEGEKERFLLDAVHLQPMALRDRQDGDYEAHMRVDEFNKRVLDPRVVDTRSNDESIVARLLGQTPELEGKRAYTMLTDSRGQQKAWLQHSSLIKSEEDLAAEVEIKLLRTASKEQKKAEKATKRQAEVAYEEYAKSVIGDIDKFR